MEKVLKQKNGITLIALVITIIVLLILAGISISMLSGDNGILQKATDAKTNTEKANEKEQIQIEVLGSYNESGELKIATVNANIKNNISGVTTDDATDFPLTVTYTTSGNKYKVDGNGMVDAKVPSVAEYVKVGDYINYDPTDGVTNTSILTYTSLKGNGQSHGNGNYSQSFTAKSTNESNLKWRVLNVSDDKIEIVSAERILADDKNKNSGSFLLKGIGYLYAEQELNEICKIYGYGKGADTSQVTTYTIGGPALGEETTSTIVGSGARSITVEDINKIAKVGETKDGTKIITSYTDLDSKYGSTSNPTANIYYATTSTATGKSTSARNKKFKIY